MSGTLMVVRAAMRRHTRSLVAIALLIGFAGGAVMIAAAGARRTTTSLERFRTESLAGDVELDISKTTPAQLAKLRRVPEVEEIGRLRQVMLAPPGGGESTGYLPAAAALDASFGRDIDRPRVIEGRRADPKRVRDLEISEAFASMFDLSVGDTLALSSYSPKQIELGASGQDPGPPAGPRVTFDVVGIVRRPLDLGISGASGGVLIPTPAFNERYQDEIGGFVDGLLRVRTRDGDADVPKVIAAAREIFGEDLFQTIGVGDETKGVSDAINVLATALWIFGAIAAVAGATAIGIVVTRQLGGIERDQETLSAVGFTARQRSLAATAVAVPAALGGAFLALVVALAASPLLPFGIARKAEVHPGFQADFAVLALGVLAIVLFTLTVSALAGLRVSRSVARARRQRRAARPSAIARAATIAGASPAMSTGLRMALEPGRGRTAVPVRSALFGTVLGALGVTAVLVFGASLDHLAATPRLYGWEWDATLMPTKQFTPGDSEVCGDVKTGMERDPQIAALAAICLEGVEVDGHPVTGWFPHALRGSVPMTLVSGRLPSAADEVALGRETLENAGKGVGDTVRIRGEETKPYRIVGQAVLPHLSFEDTDPIAEGAVFAEGAILDLFAPIEAENMYFVGRFTESVDAAQLPRTDEGGWKLATAIATPPSLPSEVDRLEQVDHLPPILGALLALLALASVAHVVAVAVRRRRQDLAVLRAIGFVRRNVRATVAYQATVLGIVGLLIGIPLGFVVGRLAWSLVARGLGVATEIDAPTAALALAALLVLVVVNVIGSIGAAAAVRDRPARVLATE